MALVAALMVAGMGVASAQRVYDPEPLFDVQARASVGLSHQFFHLMTLTGELEGRAVDKFSAGRSYSTVDINFAPLQWLHAGFGYTFIYQTPYARHRGYLDVEGIWQTGEWTFSLKERLQMTNKVWDINDLELPRNLVELKSRVMAQYDLAQYDLKPYLSFEIRNQFNGVKYASYSTFRTESLTYSDVYINRLRTTIGTEWKFAPHEILDAYLMYDYGYDRLFDIPEDDEIFRSITNQFKHTFSFGLRLWFRI